MIKELYKDNLSLHKELSKQSKVIDEAQKYQKERDSILADNKELHNTVKQLEEDFDNKAFDMEWEYKNKIRKLEKENSHLHKIIDRFYKTIDKFIEWICAKFNFGDSKELVKKFQDETHILIDPVKQLQREEREKDYEKDI